MMAKGYSLKEKAEFQKACPKDVKLHYNYQTGDYEFLYKPAGARVSRLIGAIPRARVVRWRRPNTIMNHAVRHALYGHKLPTKVKICGTLVDVYKQ